MRVSIFYKVLWIAAIVPAIYPIIRINAQKILCQYAGANAPINICSRVQFTLNSRLFLFSTQIGPKWKLQQKIEALNCASLLCNDALTGYSPRTQSNCHVLRFFHYCQNTDDLKRVRLMSESYNIVVQVSLNVSRISKKRQYWCSVLLPTAGCVSQLDAASHSSWK